MNWMEGDVDITCGGGCRSNGFNIYCFNDGKNMDEMDMETVT